MRVLVSCLLLASLAGCAPVVSQHGAGTVTTKETSPSPAEKPDYEAALLLPLAGDHQELGQALLDAAQLAIYDSEASRIRLRPLNEFDETEATASVVREAEIVLGPVFGANTRLWSVRAGAVPVLTLSNDLSLAGHSLYVTGLTPATQVRRVLEYAAGLGMKRLGLFIPHTPYGQVVEQAARDAATAAGLTIVTIAAHPAAGDTTTAAQSFLAAATAQGGIEALLLPEAKQAATLRSAGYTGRFLGMAAWEAASSSPAIIGSLYPATDRVLRQQFSARFQSVYGYAPPPLAATMYDITRLATQMDPASGSILGQLRDSGLQTGQEGAFRLDENGRVDRALAIYEITATGPRLVGAAGSF